MGFHRSSVFLAVGVGRLKRSFEGMRRVHHFGIRKNERNEKESAARLILVDPRPRCLD